MIELYTAFGLICFLFGYIVGIKRERKRHKENMEGNLQKTFEGVLNKAVPTEKIAKWN
jgi:hypothetical protein